MRKATQKPVLESKANSLELMCRYIAAQNPRALMQVMYSAGFLPYDAKKEPVSSYLLKHAIQLVKEDGDKGIVQLLNVHPDKDLILEVFQKSSSPAHVKEPVKVTPAGELNYTGEDITDQPGYNVAPVFPRPVTENFSTDKGAVIGLLLLITILIIVIC